MFETLGYVIADGIATITLKRPDRLNAFTRAMAEEFVHAIDLSDADDTVRAVIVTGEGRAFSAGADLADGPASMVDNDAAEVQRDFGGVMTLRLFDSLKPVIGAVNGPAIGVGATLLLAMDARLCTERARFGFVFVARGIVPESASSWFLPRIVGISTALQWCLSGAMVPADEALRAGLVSEVVAEPDLLPEARALARRFMGGAPASVALTRRMLWTMLGASHPMEAHILDSHVLGERGQGPDIAEGIASFLEKRPPDFSRRMSDVPVAELLAPWAPRPFA